MVETLSLFCSVSGEDRALHRHTSAAVTLKVVGFAAVEVFALAFKKLRWAEVNLRSL